MGPLFGVWAEDAKRVKFGECCDFYRRSSVQTGKRKNHMPYLIGG